MKAGFTTLAQVLAVCLSLSLLGGYVWYRYDTQKKDEELRQAARERAKQKASEASDFSGPPMEGSGEVLMSSSKNPSRVLMPSSKSRIALEFSEPSDEEAREFMESLQEAKEGGMKDQEPKDEEGKERVLLPGSKSFPMPTLPESKKQQQK